MIKLSLFFIIFKSGYAIQHYEEIAPLSENKLFDSPININEMVKESCNDYEGP